MCHVFFIHSSDDGHLGCFHVLAIVNRAALFPFSFTSRTLYLLCLKLFNGFITLRLLVHTLKNKIEEPHNAMPVDPHFGFTGVESIARNLSGPWHNFIFPSLAPGSCLITSQFNCLFPREASLASPRVDVPVQGSYRAP